MVVVVQWWGSSRRVQRFDGGGLDRFTQVNASHADMVAQRRETKYYQMRYYPRSLTRRAHDYLQDHGTLRENIIT